MGIQDMMKQAQEMQEGLQRDMSELTVQATSGGGSTFADSAISAPSSSTDFAREFFPDGSLRVFSERFLEPSLEAFAFDVLAWDALVPDELDFTAAAVCAADWACELVLAADSLFDDFDLALPMPNNGNGINVFRHHTCLVSICYRALRSSRAE